MYKEYTNWDYISLKQEEERLLQEQAQLKRQYMVWQRTSNDGYEMSLPLNIYEHICENEKKLKVIQTLILRHKWLNMWWLRHRCAAKRKRLS